MSKRSQADKSFVIDTILSIALMLILISFVVYVYVAFGEFSP